MVIDEILEGILVFLHLYLRPGRSCVNILGDFLVSIDCKEKEFSQLSQNRKKLINCFIAGVYIEERFCSTCILLWKRSSDLGVAFWEAGAAFLFLMLFGASW